MIVHLMASTDFRTEDEHTLQLVERSIHGKKIIALTMRATTEQRRRMARESVNRWTALFARIFLDRDLYAEAENGIGPSLMNSTVSVQAMWDLQPGAEVTAEVVATSSNAVYSTRVERIRVVEVGDRS